MKASASLTTEDRRALAFLAALAIVAYVPYLLSGVGFLYGDPLDAYRPLHRWVLGGLLEGRAEWCPHLGLGQSPVAISEVPVLYAPFTVLGTLFGFDRAMSLLLPLHAFLGSSLTYLLARARGAGSGGACVAAAAFGLSGWMLGHLPHTMMMWTAAWLPGLLLGVERSLHGRAARPSMWLVVSTAATLVAGAPTVAVISAVGAAIYAATRVISERRSGDAAMSVVRIALAVVIGAGLAAPQVLPILLHLPNTGRGAALTADAVLEISYHPKQLLTMGAPFALGVPVSGRAVDPLRYFGAARFEELSAYTGLLTLLVAPLALLDRVRRRRAAVLVAAVGIAFCVALGRHTPLGAALAGVPGLSSFRVLPRFLLLATLALGLLGALGLDALVAAPPARRRGLAKCLAALAVVLGCGLVASTLFGDALVEGAVERVRRDVLGAPGREASDAYYLAWPGALLATLTAALWRPFLLAGAAALALWRLSARHAAIAVVLLVAADMASMQLTFEPPRPAPEPAQAALLLRARGHTRVHGRRRLSTDDRRSTAVLARSTPLLHGLTTPDSAWMLADRRVRNLLHLSDPRPRPEDGAISAESLRVLRLLGVEAVLSDAEEGPPASTGEPVVTTDDGVAIAEVAGPLPRAYCVQSVLGTPEAELPRRSLSEDVVGGAVAIVPEGNPLAASTLSGDAGAAVRWTRDEPTRIELAVDARAPSLLVVNDAYAKGWSAEVDGEPVHIALVNGFARGVLVPEGASVVEMRYALPGWRAGWLIALVAALGLTVLLLRGRQDAERAPST